MSLQGEERDKMRAPDELEKEARDLDTIITNLDTVVGTMGRLRGLSMEVGAAAGSVRRWDGRPSCALP